MKKEKVLGINVCVTDYEKLMKQLDKDIQGNKKSVIVAINPEKVLKAQKSKSLFNLLNSIEYPIADGIGIVYASRLKKGSIKKRITGIDCMDAICQLANKKKYKVFLYGAKEEIVLSAKKSLIKKYKHIKIVGIMNGYEKNEEKIINTINKSKAQIIFVALGSPKQEEWIIKNKSKLDVNIYQGVGGSFDVLSGKIKRAPKYMQRLGLEWFYRLIKEPKRIIRQLVLVKFFFIVIFYKKSKEIEL